MKLKPKPLTTANAELFSAWAEKLNVVIKESQSQKIARMVSDVIEGDPVFAAAVESMTAGSVEAEKILATWARSNTVIAARMHRTLSHIPMTISALKLALDCIRETAVDSDAIEYEAITYEDARDYCAVILDMVS
jgi:hypothetical protein